MPHHSIEQGAKSLVDTRHAACTLQSLFATKGYDPFLSSSSSSDEDEGENENGENYYSQSSPIKKGDSPPEEDDIKNLDEDHGGGSSGSDDNDDDKDDDKDDDCWIPGSGLRPRNMNKSQRRKECQNTASRLPKFRPGRSLRDGKENKADSTQALAIKVNATLPKTKQKVHQARTTKRSSGEYKKRKRPITTIVDPFESVHRMSGQSKALDFVTAIAANHYAGNDQSEEDWTVHDLRSRVAPFLLQNHKLPAGAAMAANTSCNIKRLVVRGSKAGAAKGKKGTCNQPLSLPGGGIGDVFFAVRKYLGGGSYGSVFSLIPAPSAQPVTPSALLSSPMALKVEYGGVRHLPWECFIMSLLRRRILGGKSSPNFDALSLRSKEFTNLLVVPKQLVLYRNACCLVLPEKSGTLLQLLKGLYREPKKGISEACAAFYAAKMLRALELLFSADILHGDLKLDNWVIRTPVQNRGSVTLLHASVTSAPASPASLVAEHGLSLIDFGHSIDLKYFPKGARMHFTQRSMKIFGDQAEDIVCGRQWRGKNWLHDIDLHGVGVCLLYIAMPSELKVKSILKRFQQYNSEYFDYSDTDSIDSDTNCHSSQTSHQKDGNKGNSDHCRKDSQVSKSRRKNVTKHQPQSSKYGLAPEEQPLLDNANLPRGWNAAVWTDLFQSLFYPPQSRGCGTSAVVINRLLRQHRLKLEAIVEAVQPVKLGNELNYITKELHL